MPRTAGSTKIGRPKKQVTDPARAEVLTEAMRDAARVLRETTVERRRLAVEAYGLGMTLDAVGEACDVSGVAVRRWVQASASDSREAEGAEDVLDSTA